MINQAISPLFDPYSTAEGMNVLKGLDDVYNTYIYSLKSSPARQVDPKLG